MPSNKILNVINVNGTMPGQSIAYAKMYQEEELIMGIGARILEELQQHGGRVDHVEEEIYKQYAAPNEGQDKM